MTAVPMTFIPDDNDDGQTELLKLQEDSGSKMKYEDESLTVFGHQWQLLTQTYMT